MFLSTHINTVTKWLIKGLFLVLATFLLFPSMALAADKTLTISAESGGTVSVSPGPKANGKYSDGTKVTITATPTPNSCYVFNKWAGSPVDGSIQTPISFNMNANYSITAKFTFTGNTISASVAGAGGTISPSGNTTVCSGNNQTYTFTPNTGYSLGTYTVDNGTPVSAASGSYTFSNVTAGHSISVSFVLRTFTITASAGTGGTISPSGVTTVNYGDSRSFTITPNTAMGYSIDKVTVDGTDINLSGTTYSFSSIQGNHTISATFKVSGGGQGGTSYIPGCAASTYTSYSSGFNAADFNLTNTAVVNGTMTLLTGNQALDPNNIVIPFTQQVGVTFLYENAGFSQTNFGWMLAAGGASGTKHLIYEHINDNNNNGVLDNGVGIGGGKLSDGTDCSPALCYRNWETADVNSDGTVNMLDSRVVLGTFAGGTELVFYIDATGNGSDGGVYYTKTAWNTDAFNGYCTSASFDKLFYLGTYSGYSNCGPSQWLDSDAVTRLATAPLNLGFGTTTKSIHIDRGQIFPHVIVGAPATQPNEWVLGWEDWKTGGDYDINDLVIRIDRQTGGMAQLSSAQAVTPSDPGAYFTSVTLEVYDNIPCPGKTNINYFVSIDNGVNWVQISNWDIIKTFTGSRGSEVIGNTVDNWSPGNPAQTYRLRRVDFAATGLQGRQLIWKAEMMSNDVNCVPQIIDVALSGSVATNGLFSRASPSVQTNVLYSGSYETPAVSWTDKTLRGHLNAVQLYDPAIPSVQSIASLWDAGAVLTAMSPASRTIYFPNVTSTSVVSETVARGDGTTTHFSGTLAHHPVSGNTVTINGGIETFEDQHTNSLVGDKGGTGTINRFTGVFDLTFATPPTSNFPIVAAYTYYTTSSTLNLFTAANLTNSMLGIDQTYVYPNGYTYDFTKNGVVDSSDGAWLVNWVRGYKNPTTSTKKEWLLGAIDHSVPAIETPPGRPAWYFGTAVTDAERLAFDTFAQNKYTRPTVAYVGSRDGMLHAFNAGKFRWKDFSNTSNKWGDNPKTTDLEYRGYFEWQGTTSSTADYGTGAELWAFIPANLISRLKNNLLSGEDQAYVDGSPAISDVVIGGTWKTVLLCAEGNGGDTVFCLDVTNPLSPTFLWEFADPDLFRSRSSPSVAVIGQTVYNGTKKWVAFFVSGKTYDNTLYPSIYMIDIADGSVLRRVFLDSEPTGICGVPSGQPAVVDSDGNGYIDRIYVGTDKGYLYKVTIPDDPNGSSGYGITSCVINTDFSYTDTANVTHSIASSQQYHPIYASPAVVVENTFSSSGEIEYNIKIMFGTGDSPYYDENINTADTTYHFFVYRDEAKKNVCKSSSTASLDWFYTLPAGERIFASAFAAAGSIYFGTSTSETEDPCEGAGNATANSGRLYAMSINTGALVASPITTGNILTAPVVDDQHVYVKAVGSGLRTNPGAYNNPIIMGGLVETTVKTWREIFNKDESLQ